MIPVMPYIFSEDTIIYQHGGMPRLQYLFTNDIGEFVIFNKYQLELMGIDLNQSNQILYMNKNFNFKTTFRCI